MMHVELLIVCHVLIVPLPYLPGVSFQVRTPFFSSREFKLGAVWVFCDMFYFAVRKEA